MRKLSGVDWPIFINHCKPIQTIKSIWSLNSMMGVSVGTTQFGFYSFCLKLTLKISINFDIKLCAHVCSSTESKAITEIVTCKSNDIVIFRQILRKCHCIWLTNENFPLFYLIHCAFIQLNPPKKKNIYSKAQLHRSLFVHSDHFSCFGIVIMFSENMCSWQKKNYIYYYWIRSVCGFFCRVLYFST